MSGFVVDLLRLDLTRHHERRRGRNSACCFGTDVIAECCEAGGEKRFCRFSSSHRAAGRGGRLRSWTAKIGKAPGTTEGALMLSSTSFPFARYGLTICSGIVAQPEPASRKSSRDPISTKRQIRELTTP